MRVAAKLAAGYGLLIVLLAAIVLYHVAVIHGMASTNARLSSLVLRLSRTATEQLFRLDELDEDGSKYWVTRDSGYVEHFDEARSAFDQALVDLAALDLSADERAQLDSLAFRWAQLFPPEASVHDLIEAHQGLDVDAPGFVDWLGESTSLLRGQTRAVYSASERAMGDEVSASLGAAERVERLSWVALVSALTLSLTVFGLVVRSITGSLSRLRRGTHAVADGNFEHRLEEPRSDEFAELADSFNVMTQRLRELETTKRDFLSQVSHDLKSPLAAIQDASLLLLDEVPGTLSVPQRRLLEHNVSSGQRLASMIGKLLDVSRLDAGAVEYRFEPCDLSAVIKAAMAEFESPAERRWLHLEADLPERPLTVEGDAERVRQVLDNLLENALRFSPDGGVVQVQVRAFSEGSGFALIAVADAGPGVPDEEKTRIFERFHQTAAGRSRPGRGVGLGLALCREVVHAHGGRIWVSDQPTGGSIFSVLLPLAGPRPPSPAQGNAR